MSSTGRKRKHRPEKTTIMLLPKRLEIEKLKAKRDPILTFHLSDFLGGTIDTITITQSDFFAETRTVISEVLDNEEGEMIDHNFRILLGAARQADVAPQWEAFGCFISWLGDGVYDNPLVESSHIDAYIFSKTIQAPRFGNAVMEVILDTMSTRKYDADSTKMFRQIFQHCEIDSPLRTLYLETIHFWGFYYQPNGKGVTIDLAQGQEFLKLDDAVDEGLIQALRHLKYEQCPCWVKHDKARRVLAEMKTANGDVPLKCYKLEDEDENEECICKLPPWLKNRERFFTAT